MAIQIVNEAITNITGGSLHVYYPNEESHQQYGKKRATNTIAILFTSHAQGWRQLSLFEIKRNKNIVFERYVLMCMCAKSPYFSKPSIFTSFSTADNKPAHTTKNSNREGCKDLERSGGKVKVKLSARTTLVVNFNHYGLALN